MHLDREVLHAFLRGELARTETRRVVRHLLAGCQPCREVARELAEGVAPPPEIDLTAIARDVWEKGQAFDREKRAAPALVAELEAQTPARQLLLVTNSGRFRNRAVCALLCDSALALCPQDPHQAVARATLARELAETLPVERYGKGMVNDARARAWSVLGHAQRETSELRAAEASFARAVELVGRGSGDPVEIGRVWYLKAMLRHTQRRFDEALALYRRAEREFHAARDHQLVGSVHIDRARTLYELGDLERAVARVRAGLEMLDPERNPRMSLVGKHNLTLYLQQLGRTREALEMVGELLPLHAQVGGGADRLRLVWLEGKIAHAQGDLERAARKLRTVREGFIERTLPFEAAQASLDLAAVCLRQGDLAQVERLARETVEVFGALGVDREAIAAVALLERAVRSRDVSLTLVAELAAYLKQAARHPGLVFRPANG